MCDLVGEDAIRESMLTLRNEIADLQQRLDDAKRTAADLPHRAKYLQLVIAFLRRLLELHLELVDTVDREFTTANQPADLA